MAGQMASISYLVVVLGILSRICEMVLEFHRRGKLSKEANATFFAFLPKMANPVDLRDYRPISLGGCAYKLYSKALANRLKSVLPSIISPFQGAFVPGKQVLDGVLIATELIDSRIRSKQGGTVLKIDLEKKYDHVGGVLLSTC